MFRGLFSAGARRCAAVLALCGLAMSLLPPASHACEGPGTAKKP